MRRYLTALLLVIALLSASRKADAETDSTRRPRWAPFAATIGAGWGHVVKPKIVEKFNITFPSYQAVSASVLVTRTRAKLIDTLYGQPYFGFGVYKPFFHKSELLGDPISFYVIYGLTILQLGEHLSFDTEAKLGASVGWSPFNSITNHKNRIIGAKNNYHASADFFLKYRINRTLQARVGATYAHFSDGAYRLPNSGLNTIGGFTDLMVSFRERPYINRHQKKIDGIKHHMEYDLGVCYSSRQILGEVESTSATVILNHSFKALDFSAYAMYVGSHYLRIGLGLHLIYDESSNITTNQTLNEDNVTYTSSYIPSSTNERFSTGVFGKAEIPLGYVNALFDYGYIFNSHATDKSFSRLNLGLKSYVYRGLNATFGIQFTPRNESNCVFFGLGYTFGHHSPFR